MNTYVQVGKVEEISEEISLISPTNTPFYSMIGSESVSNTLYEWMEDKLDAPASNAAVEGADAPAANQVPVSMRQNYTQIFTKTVSTTGTADKMALHGKPGVEFARQMAKKSKEIKRDVEYALVGTRQAAAAGNSTTARTFGGAQAQFDASVTLDAATTALTETLIETAAQNAYTQGGDPDTLIIKPSDSIKISAFAAATGRQRFLEADGKKIVNVVNIYVTPFGELKVVMDRWIAATDALLVDAGMWKLKIFRNWFTKQLAETGDAHKSQIIGEFGLAHRNYFSGAMIINLT